MDSRTITDLVASKRNFILDVNAPESFVITSFSSFMEKTRLVKNRV